MTERSPPPTPGEPAGRPVRFPPPEGPGDRVMMITGLVGGVALSAVAWGVFFKQMNVGLVTVLIGAKVIAALACVFRREWRPLGQGLLASIAIGAGIFVWRLCGSLG